MTSHDRNGQTSTTWSLEQRLADWIRESALADDCLVARLSSIGLGRLSSYVFPEGRPAELLLFTQWMAFICAVDDVFDLSNSGGRPQQVEALMNELLSVVKAHPHPRTHPLGDVLADLWCRTATEAPDRWINRFVAAYSEFADASVEEARSRESGVAQGIEGYLLLRRRTITALPTLDVLERLSSIDLPDEWYQHTLVQELLNAMADAIGLANDLASGLSEAKRGQETLISTIARQENRPPVEARQKVKEMLVSRLQRFDAAEARLFGLLEHHPYRSAVIAYMSMTRRFLHGSLRWYAETTRFEEPHDQPSFR